MPVAFVLLLLFAGCNSSEKGNGGENGVYFAFFSDLEYINDDSGVQRSWEGIGEVTLYNLANENGITVEVASASAEVILDAGKELTSPVYALAPANKGSLYYDGEFAIKVPAELSGTGMAAVPAFARSVGGRLQFRTLTGLFKVHVDQPDMFCKMSLTANGGEKIAGMFVLDPSLADFTLSGGSVSTLSFSPGGTMAEGDYYFPVVCSSLKQGVTLSLEAVDGSKYEQACALYPRAGQVYSFGNTSDWTEGSGARLSAGNHPRLVMNDAAFREAMARRTSNSVLNRIHNQIIANANASIGESALVFKLDASGKRILEVSNNALLQIFSCAYAYRATGQQKYLDQAEMQMRAVCSFSSWNAKSHFLDTGEMAAAVGLGYDWLYGALSQSTKDMAVTAIRNFAFTPVFTKQWSMNFFNNEGNWEQVCCGGLVTGALAIYEACPDDAQLIIDQCITSNRRIASILYSPDGNYPEGYGYWGYGCMFQALMNMCLESAIGEDNYTGIDGIRNTPRFFMFMEGPTGYNYNYYDTSPMTQSAGLAMWYFAYKEQDPSILSNEMQKFNAGGYYNKSSDVSMRLLPMLVHFAANLDFSAMHGPMGKLYVGNGHTPVIAGRSAWTGLKSETDVYFGFKGGKASENHGHMDAGSFIFDAQGVRWAWDFTRPAYSTIENALKAAGGNFWAMGQNSLRWTVNVMNNKCHNTLTVNGADHIVGGKAEIVSKIENSNEYGGTIDITPALSGQISSAVRTVKLVDDARLVVIDKLKALPSKTAEVEWRMMTPASAVIEDGHFVLTCNGKTEYLKVASDHTFTLCTFDLSTVNSYDTVLNSYRAVGFRTTLAEGEEAEFTTILTEKL